jgi:hypothetical protein
MICTPAILDCSPLRIGQRLIRNGAPAANDAEGSGDVGAVLGSTVDVGAVTVDGVDGLVAADAGGAVDGTSGADVAPPGDVSSEQEPRPTTARATTTVTHTHRDPRSRIDARPLPRSWYAAPL